MVNYFIHYSYSDRTGHGIGNTDITIDKPISNMDVVVSIQNALKEKNDYESVLLISWIKFEPPITT